MDFDMGKYGLFVWGSYGLSFLGLAGLVLLSVRSHRAKARALAVLNETLKARQTPPTPVAAETAPPAKERSA